MNKKSVSESVIRAQLARSCLAFGGSGINKAFVFAKTGSPPTDNLPLNVLAIESRRRALNEIFPTLNARLMPTRRCDDEQLDVLVKF